MVVSKILYENLIKISEQIKYEKNLAIDLIYVNGVECVFISKTNIDRTILKFIKQYFGDVKGFENMKFTQSLEIDKKQKQLSIEKSYEIYDVRKFLIQGFAVLVIEGIPQIYGIGTKNSDMWLVQDSIQYR